MCFLPPPGLMRQPFGGAAGPNLLADFNFSAPLASWTTGRTGFSSAFATDEWLMQAHTAGDYANNVGSATLDDDAGLTDQTCPVINDGSYGNRNCWESNGSANSLACSDASVMDSDSTEIAGRVAFSSLVAQNTNYLVWKATAAVPITGFRIFWLIGGILRIEIGDGANSASVDTTLPYNDGAPHYVAWHYDPPGDTLDVKTDLETFATVDTSAVTASISRPAEPLRINGRSSGGSTGSPMMQVHAVSVCDGSGSADHFAETFWQHGQDPTGLLTKTDRQCTVSVPLSATTMGHFSGSATLGKCQLPIGYLAGLSDADKLALFGNGAQTNLVPWSEALSNWTQSGTSVTTDNETDAPDGFRSASKIVAGAANDTITCPAYTTLALKWYGTGVWIKGVAGHIGATGRVIWYDESNVAEEASTVFTTTTSWQFVKVVADNDSGAVSMSVKIEIDTSGAEIYAWGASTLQGWTTNQCLPYFRTAGAAAAGVDSQYDCSTGVVNAKRGEIKSTFVWLGGTQIGGVYAAPGDSLINSRQLSHTAVATFQAAAMDDAATTEAFTNISVAGGTEYVHRLIYDDSAAGDSTGGFEHLSILNGVTTNGAASPWEGTSGDLLQGIRLFSSQLGVRGPVAIQRLQIWDDASGEAIP